MEEDNKKQETEETQQQQQQQKKSSGWGFSAFSVLSDLQKAAEEISRNAVEAAEKAAKSIADMQNFAAEDSESSSKEEDHEEKEKEKEKEESEIDKETDDEKSKLRKFALDKLENASQDSFLGQGLKVFDNSVENFASGAWQALGSAFRGGSNFVQKLENSAVNLAGSIHQGSLPGGTASVAPSLLETGKAYTAKGMQVLEYVGKETMDLLITETGIEVDKNSKGSDREHDEDQLLEDVTFDRCFYIYGGPEQLEELEALSSHYSLLFNRRKAKLSVDQKSVFDGKLKLIQQIFNLSVEIDENSVESNKGKKVETGTEGSIDEMKILHDSSVSKAADMAAGFTSALAGLTANDIVQRTASRLETLHSEGIHRLSEMCSSAVSQLLMLGKSIISDTNSTQEENLDGDEMNINWPEDSVEKAKVIRTKAQSMAGYVEAVSNSFITGISDVAEAYVAAMKTVSAGANSSTPKTSIQEKANTFSELIRTDRTTAVSKVQDGLQYLSYVVVSTSIPAA